MRVSGFHSGTKRGAAEGNIHFELAVTVSFLSKDKLCLTVDIWTNSPGKVSLCGLHVFMVPFINEMFAFSPIDATSCFEGSHGEIVKSRISLPVTALTPLFSFSVNFHLNSVPFIQFYMGLASTSTVRLRLWYFKKAYSKNIFWGKLGFLDQK